MSGRGLLPLALLASLLAACGQSHVVRHESTRPVERRPAPLRPVLGSYVVQRGDTLYGIAFRHGLDFREIAAWNRIVAPYTIYPGQRLRLQGSTHTASAPVRNTTSQPATPRPPPAATAPRAYTAPPVPSRPIATTATQPPTAVENRVEPKPAVMSAPVLVAPGRWTWPTTGNLIGRYVAGDPTQQGIDIAGRAGQPVAAAADGVVVYSGTGLVGYGEVIIVKHNDEWLSAYGHNRARLVKEGEAVKAGQTIAELGRSGTSRDMLHFEIRRNGKPVDPLSLLPAR